MSKATFEDVVEVHATKTVYQQKITLVIKDEE